MWRILRSWRIRRLARRNPYRAAGPAYQGPFGPAFYSSLNLHARSPAENQRFQRLRRRRRIRWAVIAVLLLVAGWILSESMRGLKLF